MPDEQATPRQTFTVPLFPLPNVVLFPRAVLPLHVFEERYKSMAATALDGDRKIAMALLRPGWEKNYHGAAVIEPVVCIGHILTHERLPDGRFNLFLQGTARARVIEEIQVQPYRVAELETLADHPVIELDLSNQRRQLISIFSNGRFSSIPLCQRFLEMLSSHASTSDIADLIAFNLVDDVKVKQQLLAEPDPRRRAERVASLLERLQILPGIPPEQMTANPSFN